MTAFTAMNEEGTPFVHGSAAALWPPCEAGEW